MKYTSVIYAREILKDIENKKIIVYKRNKNDEILIKYSLNQEDIEEIIHGLTDNHFKERIINLDKRIIAEYLYIFKVSINLNDGYGMISKYIYIKICEIKKGILVVSLHEDE